MNYLRKIWATFAVLIFSVVLIVLSHIGSVFVHEFIPHHDNVTCFDEEIGHVMVHKPHSWLEDKQEVCDRLFGVEHSCIPISNENITRN